MKFKKRQLETGKNETRITINRTCFTCSVPSTGPPLSHSVPLKTLQECPTPESTLVIMLHSGHPTISKDQWMEGALLIWGPGERYHGWTVLTRGRVHTVADGTLGVGTGTTLGGGLHSVTRTELVDQPRIDHGKDHGTGMSLCPI